MLPRGRARCKRPLQHRAKRGGICLRAHPQPVVEIAFRAEVLRRDEHASAGPEGARERHGPVGRIAVERHLDPARQAEQRLPCRLPGRECCRARDLK